VAGLQTEPRGHGQRPARAERDFDLQRALEVYYVEIDGRTALDADPRRGKAEGHVFVLRGTVEATVGGTSRAMQADHEIRFPANCPHA
jgi:hypothetical protein